MHKRFILFTLIELLIVISVIAVLTGMLLPALNTARQKAHGAGCLNQVSQLGKAFACYVSDYQWLPVNSDGARNCWGVAHSTSMIAEYLGLLGDSRNIGKIAPDGSRSRFACPANTILNSMSYGYNNQINLDNPIRRRMNLFAAPGRTALTTESVVQAQSFQNEWLPEYSSFMIAYRHSGRNNVLFADFHASGLGKKQIPHNNLALPGYTPSYWKVRFWFPEVRMPDGTRVVDLNWY